MIHFYLNYLILDFLSTGPGKRFSFMYGFGSCNCGVGFENDYLFLVSLTLNEGCYYYYNGTIGCGYGGGWL